MTVLDDKEPFNFATYNPKTEKGDDDLWSPKKLTPYPGVAVEDSYSQPKYPNSKPKETFTANVPNIKILFEIEQKNMVPVVLLKVTMISNYIFINLIVMKYEMYFPYFFACERCLVYPCWNNNTTYIFIIYELCYGFL